MKVYLAETDRHLIKAKQIHQRATVFDGHCDTILEVMNHKRTLEKKSTTGHLDIPRMQEGGVDVQFFAVFIEDIYKPDRSLKRTLQLIVQFQKEFR